MPILAAVLIAQVWSDFYSFGMSIGSTLVFVGMGIALAVIGFKILDFLTPGKLDEEILQKQNVAAAILAGSFVLGICIIIAAAIHG